MRRALIAAIRSAMRKPPPKASSAAPIIDEPWKDKRVSLRDRFTYQGIEPSTDDDWARLVAKKKGKKVRLRMRDLIATQDTVNARYQTVPSLASGELPKVVRERGKIYIQDGHHRIAARQDRGEDAVDVLLYDSNW